MSFPNVDSRSKNTKNVYQDDLFREVKLCIKKLSTLTLYPLHQHCKQAQKIKTYKDGKRKIFQNNT